MKIHRVDTQEQFDALLDSTTGVVAVECVVPLRIMADRIVECYGGTLQAWAEGSVAEAWAEGSVAEALAHGSVARALADGSVAEARAEGSVATPYGEEL